MLYRELLSRVRLFKNQSYVFFALSGIAATIGNGLVYITTSWYAYEYFQSISGVSLLMFCIWAPSIIFGPFFGVCADRYNRKMILVLSNVVRGVAICLFVLLELLNWHNNIFVLAIVLGVFVSFYMPAAIPMITQIVKEEDLPKANATVDMLYEVGTIIGMGLSGVFIYAFGSVWTLFVGGILFIVSGYFNVLMRYQHDKKEVLNRQSTSFIREYIESIKYIFNKKGVVSVYLVQTFVMVLLMTIPVLLVPYVNQVLHASSRIFALFEMVYSMGVFIGCFFTPMLCEKLRFRVTVASLMFVMFLMLLLIATNLSMVISLISYFVIGFCLSSWALSIAQAQIHTDVAYQGRAQSTFNSLSGIGILILYLLVTFEGKTLHTQALYFAEAIIALVGSLIVILATTEPQKVAEHSAGGRLK